MPAKQKQLFWSISLLIAFIDISFIALNYYSSKQALLKEFSQEANIYSSSFHTAQHTAENNLLLVASVFANDREIQSLFYSAKQAVEAEGGGAGGQKSATIRQALYELVWSRWKDATEHLGARQLHFHLAPGSLSFLRIHQPDKFGDRMDDVRFTIVDTNEQQKPHSGFETGRVYSGIRGVVPVFSIDPTTGATEHIGALEAGISYASLVDAFKHSTHSDVTILLTSEHIASTMWQQFIEQQIQQTTPCGCAIEATSRPLPKTILNQVKRDAHGEFIMTGKAQLLPDADGRYFVASMFPLRDYLGTKDKLRKHIGSIVIWQDVTERITAFHHSQWINLAYGTLAYLFVELLFLFAFKWLNRTLQRQIQEGVTALAKSNSRQQLLQYALDQVEDEILLVDEYAHFQYVNTGAVNKLGYQRSDLLQMTMLDIVPELSTEGWQKHWHELEKLGSLSFENIHQTQYGKHIPVEVNAVIVQLNGLQYSLSIARDISARKNYEEEVLKNHLLYRAIIDTSKDGFLMVDSLGQVLATNDTYCEMSGYSHDELRHISIQDIEGRQTADEINRYLDTIKQQGSAIFESIHRRKTGSPFPVEISVAYSPVDGGHFFSFVRDISDRKLEEEISQLHQKLTELVYEEDVDKILQTALDAAESTTGSEIGFFHYVDPDQENISLQTWSTRTLTEMCFAEGKGQHYPISKAGIWVECVYQRKPVIHNNYPLAKNRKGLPEGHAPLMRELTVPIFRNNLIVAIIGIGNKSSDYTQKDIDIVSRIADMTYEFAEHAKTRQHIEYMAYYDTLTGLPNRDLLADRLNHDIAQHKRSGNLLAICYLDLDGFKPVNDHYGHAAGDTLLAELSRRLLKTLREGDTLSRIGGDEFVFVLTSLNTTYESEVIVQRILDTIRIPFDVGEHRIYVSGTIGITLYPTDHSNAERLIRHADQAMYKAKTLGKSRYHFFNIVEEAKANSRRKLLTELHQALDLGQFVLYYQPKISLIDAQVVGFEALIRWQHPKQGLLEPGSFLPMLTGTPEEIALGDWVVQTAVQQLANWRKQGIQLPISINISPAHIQDENFFSFLQKTLDEYDENLASFLELEILETTAAEDIALMARVMHDCTSLGVSFSLDDFGTGYSSLTYFHRLPIRTLKIDQNFVFDMLHDTNDLNIIEGVIQLSHTLNRPVVAEGVESTEQGLLLMFLGCQYVQGYGIARPMPANMVEQWLLEWDNDNEWRELKQIELPHNKDTTIKVAFYSHQRWAALVKDYAESTSSDKSLPILDEQQCMFSRWYKGIGKNLYGDQPVYAFIPPKHFQVHRIAQEIITLVDEGKCETARSRLNEFDSACKQLLDMLMRLK